MPIWSPKSTIYKYVKEDVSSKLIYEGWSDDHQALDSDPKWLISRTTKDGIFTRIEYANGATPSAWTDRTSLFPGPSFSNQYSALLDGIGGRVEFGDAFNYNVSNQWSLSIWFKLDNLSTQQCLYAKTTNDVNVYGWGFYVTTAGKVFMQIRGPSGAPNHTSTAGYQAGVWNNFTFTFNGGSNQNGSRLYINGVVDTTPASAALGNVLFSQIAMVGARHSSFRLSGNVDEFSVWNKALSAADVSQIWNGGTPIDLLTHTATSNLVNYYKLGDGDSGTTVLDNKGSVNGTLIAGASFEADAP